MIQIATFVRATPVLVAPTTLTTRIGFDVTSWHELHVMVKLAQLAPPVVGRSAGLHTDDARWERLKEGQQLRALDGFVENNPASLRNAVSLKNILGQIEAEGLYCHWVAPFRAVNHNCILAHAMPVEQEPPTSSALGRARQASSH
ncbi:hypothetical protein VWY10_16500 [Phaeobacter sp. A86a-4a]